MIVATSYDQKIAAVLGLSRSGLSACRSVMAAGGRVWAWDDNLERRELASRQGIPIVNLDLCNWDRVESLVLSPGIPLRHPKPHRLLRRARAAGVPVIGDIEVLAENQPQRQMIGITGTNGKSTTSTLIDHLFQNAAVGTQLGGNIGLPVLDLLPKPSEDIYVLELSSYQLDLTERLHCAVAVILNLSPDHLERHGGMAGYVRAKRRILKNQGADDWAVIGVDDSYGQKIYRQLKAANDRKVVPVSVTSWVKTGVSVIDGELIDDIDGESRSIGHIGAMDHLQGQHNWQNAAAAYASARAFKIAPECIMRGMANFPGLGHRMELVAEIDGVRFVNDSKATNPEAAARGLACFQPIYWIAGGQPKQDNLDAVLPHLGRVRHAYLIGKAADLFQGLLADKVHTVKTETLDQAFTAAVADVGEEGLDGATVLLAPACASFDQFANFEARGHAFRLLVEALESAGGLKPSTCQALAASGGRRR